MSSTSQSSKKKGKRSSNQERMPQDLLTESSPKVIEGDVMRSQNLLKPGAMTQSITLTVPMSNMRYSNGNGNHSSASGSISQESISPRKANSARCSISLMNSEPTSENDLQSDAPDSRKESPIESQLLSLSSPQGEEHAKEQQIQLLKRRKTSKSLSNSGEKLAHHACESFQVLEEPKTAPNNKTIQPSDSSTSFESYCDSILTESAPLPTQLFHHLSSTAPLLPSPVGTAATSNGGIHNTNSNQNSAGTPLLLSQPPQLQRQPSGGNDEKLNEGSFAIFRCPIVLEKYNIKLWIVYLDNLIEVLFKTPLDAIRVFFCYMFLNQRIGRENYSVFLHVALTFLPFLLFSSHRLFPSSPSSSSSSSSTLSSYFPAEYFEVAYWYHALRGQSTLKLYGVLMTADIIDKMLCTVGEFLILDVLWQKLPQQKLSILTLVKYFLPTFLYVCLHSIVLFLSIIGYNVILNSDISSLFVLIFVHNSMKLKSSVFKKFTKDAYTQQTHEDLRARFSKFYIVFLIWASGRGFSADILRKLLYFLGAEVIIEWIKHIFLMLLNNLKLSIVENMSKACKLFVAQVRIIPAFLPQEIVNHKAVQTFQERENYLAQTPHIPPSLKVGFRVNFLPFHHAIVLLKIIHPHLISYFSLEMVCLALLGLRAIQFCNDALILKFSFSNTEIVKLYSLNHNTNLLATLLDKKDFVILAAALAALSNIYSDQIFSYYHAYVHGQTVV